MVANASALLERVLKTQEPAKFAGKDVLLMSLTYMDDLLLSGLMSEVDDMANKQKLNKPETLMNMRITASIIATVQLCLHDLEGRPIFPSFTEAFAEAKDGEKLKEMVRIHELYHKTLELTRDEKKSS